MFLLQEDPDPKCKTVSKLDDTKVTPEVESNNISQQVEQAIGLAVTQPQDQLEVATQPGQPPNAHIASTPSEEAEVTGGEQATTTGKVYVRGRTKKIEDIMNQEDLFWANLFTMTYEERLTARSGEDCGKRKYVKEKRRIAYVAENENEKENDSCNISNLSISDSYTLQQNLHDTHNYNDRNNDTWLTEAMDWSTSGEQVRKIYNRTEEVRNLVRPTAEVMDWETSEPEKEKKISTQKYVHVGRKRKTGGNRIDMKSQDIRLFFSMKSPKPSKRNQSVEGRKEDNTRKVQIVQNKIYNTKLGQKQPGKICSRGAFPKLGTVKYRQTKINFSSTSIGGNDKFSESKNIATLSQDNRGESGGKTMGKLIKTQGQLRDKPGQTTINLQVSKVIHSKSSKNKRTKYSSTDEGKD